MPYWDCPRCSTENSLDATSCWRCGYQYFPGYQDGAASHPPPRRQSRSSLEKRRQDLREKIRTELDAGIERNNASLDRLAGRRPSKKEPPGR